MKFNYIADGVELTLDDVLEVHLKPLRNLNTRKIFMLFNELRRGEGILTTLDIQRELEEQGIRLDKKEINLSLHYLARAGLIERLPQRGKPTIVEYDGRYSFDLWRIRGVGERIYIGLVNMVQGRIPEALDLDEERLFKEFEMMPPERVRKTLERSFRLSKSTTLLVSILKTREEEVSSHRLEKLTGIPRGEVETLLDKISTSTKESPRLVETKEKDSARTRILKALGLARGGQKGETVYSLTERGRKYAEMIEPRYF